MVIVGTFNSVQFFSPFGRKAACKSSEFLQPLFVSGSLGPQDRYSPGHLRMQNGAIIAAVLKIADCKNSIRDLQEASNFLPSTVTVLGR